MFDFVLNNIDDNNNMKVYLIHYVNIYIFLNVTVIVIVIMTTLAIVIANNYCNHDYINIRTCNHPLSVAHHNTVVVWCNVNNLNNNN